MSKVCYCIPCEDYFWIWSDDKFGHLHIKKGGKICFDGLYTTSAPPELPEHWEELVTEPTTDELAQMDLNAQEILLDFGL